MIKGLKKNSYFYQFFLWFKIPISANLISYFCLWLISCVKSVTFLWAFRKRRKLRGNKEITPAGYSRFLNSRAVDETVSIKSNIYTSRSIYTSNDYHNLANTAPLPNPDQTGIDEQNLQVKKIDSEWIYSMFLNQFFNCDFLALYSYSQLSSAEDFDNNVKNVHELDWFFREIEIKIPSYDNFFLQFVTLIYLIQNFIF